MSAVDVSRQAIPSTHADASAIESKLLSIISGLKSKLQESREQLQQLQLQRIKLSNYTLNIEKQNQTLRKLLHESQDFSKTLAFKKLSVFIIICLYLWSKQKRFNQIFVNKINQQKYQIDTLKSLTLTSLEAFDNQDSNNNYERIEKEQELSEHNYNNNKSQPIQITHDNTQSISPTSSISSTSSVRIADSPPNLYSTPNLVFINEDEEDDQSDENDGSDNSEVVNIVNRLKEKLLYLQTIISNDSDGDTDDINKNNNREYNKFAYLDDNRQVFKRKSNNNLIQLEPRKKDKLPPLSPSKPYYLKHRRTNSRLIRALLDSDNIYSEV